MKIKKIVTAISLLVGFAVILYLTMPESDNQVEPEVQVKETTQEVGQPKPLQSVPPSAQKLIERAEEKEDEAAVIEEEIEKVEVETQQETVTFAGREVPLLRGAELSRDPEELMLQYEYEEKDVAWAGHWENEIRTMVSFASTSFPLKKQKVDCKSSICKLNIQLTEVNGESMSALIMSLNRELINNGQKFTPAASGDGTKGIIFLLSPVGQE